MPISSALGSSALLPAGLGFRNLLINGGMQVNQRNTTVTYTGYPADRWYFTNFTMAGVSVATNTDVPTGEGFTSSMRMTTTTGQPTTPTGLISVVQRIEGFNSSQLAFGTPGAKTTALSFWVRSSVIGTHTFNIENSNSSRVYVGTYMINVADIWEKKTVIVSGDTTGTWLTNNGIGVQARFTVQAGHSMLGAGNTWTNGSYQSATGTVNDCATTGNIFAITGVQLEQNYQPTPFEQRPIGVELALCQRYYYRTGTGNGNASFRTIGNAFAYSTTAVQGNITFPNTMRVAPTAIEAYGSIRILDYIAAFTVSVVSLDAARTNNDSGTFTMTTSGLTAFRPYDIEANNSSTAALAWSAEL